MTQSIPPATNTKEIHIQRRRFAFIKLFELLCVRADCPSKPVIDVSTAERAKALDDALDELFSAEFEVVYHNDTMTPEEVQALRFEHRSRTPLFDYLRIVDRIVKLRQLDESSPAIEEEASVELNDIREFMTPEQQEKLTALLRERVTTQLGSNYLYAFLTSIHHL